MSQDTEASLEEVFKFCQETQVGLPKHVKRVWKLYHKDMDTVTERIREFLAVIFTADSNQQMFVDRAAKFFKFLAKTCPREPSQADLLFEILGECLINCRDANKLVRQRCIQIFYYVLQNMDPSIEPDDELVEQMAQIMTSRTDDKDAKVRAWAAHALTRLCFSDDGTYIEDEVTQALLELMKYDNNKMVRTAAVRALVLASDTVDAFIERLADPSFEVRKEVLQQMILKADSNPNVLRTEHRLMMLKIGLEDRNPRVHEAAIKLLEHWFANHHDGDVLALMESLQASEHQAEALLVLEALIESKALDPVQYIQEQPQMGALDAEEGEGVVALLPAVQAVTWRLLAQFIQKEATDRGHTAANGLGAHAAFARDEALSVHEALDSFLPEDSISFSQLIAAHADSGAEYSISTCQLLQIAATCWDWTDAVGRDEALQVVRKLALRDPGESDDAAFLASEESQALHADLLNALLDLAEKLHGTPAQLAAAVLADVQEMINNWNLLPTPDWGIVPEEDGDDVSTVLGKAGASKSLAARLWHALTWLGGMLQKLPPGVSPATGQDTITIQDAITRLAEPALQHPSHLVRQKAMLCIGLHCVTARSATAIPTHSFALLTAGLNSATPSVLLTSCQSILDLQLRHGPAAVNSQHWSAACVPEHHLATSTSPDDAQDGGEQRKAADPSSSTADPSLQGSLMSMMLRRLKAVVYQHNTSASTTNLAARTRGRGRQSTSAARPAANGAFPRDMEVLANTLVEGMAKLLLHHSPKASSQGSSLHSLTAQEAVEALRELLLLQVHPVGEKLPYARQCLTVFFQAYTMARVGHTALFAKSMLHAARSAYFIPLARATAAPAILKYTLQLILDAADICKESQRLQHAELQSELAVSILCEAITAAQATKQVTAGKAYVTALCKAASALTATRGQAQLCMQLLQQATQLVDPSAAKELASMQDNLQDLTAEEDEADSGFTMDQLEGLLQQWQANMLPSFSASEEQQPSTAGRRTARKGRKAAGTSSDEEEGPAPKTAAAAVERRTRPQRAASAATNQRLATMYASSSSSSEESDSVEEQDKATNQHNRPTAAPVAAASGTLDDESEEEDDSDAEVSQNLGALSRQVVDSDSGSDSESDDEDDFMARKPRKPRVMTPVDLNRQRPRSGGKVASSVERRKLSPSSLAR